jgi:hypothetical protein
VVHVPASSPHITAVGGTTAHRNIGGTYGTESWWGGTEGIVKGGQGGFGTSRFFTRPVYQNGLTTATMRSIPDISMPADPRYGYFICQESAGGCPTNLLYGGTSVAAPLLAAIVAVLNEQTGAPLGFLNTKLYPLANTPSFHSASELGSNFAHVGLGTPNVGKLFLALINATAGAYDLTKSVAGAFPPIVVANGTTKGGIAVLLRDSALNSVSGETVSVTANAGSSAVITPVNAVTNVSNGAALFTVTNTVPELVTFTATVGGQPLAQHPVIRFVSPPASFGDIAALPLALPADGNSKSTITVTLFDGEGNPTPGKLVTLAQGNGSATITALNATTDATGKARFEAANFKTESVVFTAVDVTDGNVPVPGDVTVSYLSGGTPPCNIGLGTPAAGYAASTFVSSVPGDTYTCIGPIGLAFAPNGDLLVNSNYTGDIYRFGPEGGTATAATLWSTALHGLGPTGLLFTPSGQLFAATRYPDAGHVVELDPVSGAILRTVAAINSPLDLKMDPLSGDLFVSNFDGVQRISNFATGPGTVSPYLRGALHRRLCVRRRRHAVRQVRLLRGFHRARQWNRFGDPGCIYGRGDRAAGRRDRHRAEPGQPGAAGAVRQPDRRHRHAGRPVHNAADADRHLHQWLARRLRHRRTGWLLLRDAGRPGDQDHQGRCELRAHSDHDVPEDRADPRRGAVAGPGSDCDLYRGAAKRCESRRNADHAADLRREFRAATGERRRRRQCGVHLCRRASRNRPGDGDGEHRWHPVQLEYRLGLLGRGQPPDLHQPEPDPWQCAAEPAACVAREADRPGRLARGAGAGRSISLTFAGKNCSAMTDAFGVATCLVTPNLQSGRHPITATFAGGGNLLASSATASVELMSGPALLDVDLNGVYDANTDGVLVVRYLLGLRGTALVANALGPSAFRTDPDDIAAYLQSLGLALDADGDQQLDALTDGLLIFRYLSGLRGNGLINGVLGTQATRSSDTAVADYLNSVAPPF